MGTAPADRRIGLLFNGAPRVPEMVRLARRAETAGYESIWMAETRLTRDGFVPLAAMAMATDRIKLGTGIVNVFTREAVVMAISFTTLAEVAPGRTIVGLGAGSPIVLGPQGVEWARPLARLREYVEVIRPLTRGEAVSYEGETIRLDGACIEDVLAEREKTTSEEGELPVYLGVTAMKAVELAGELADGVLYNTCMPTGYVERARAALARGAARGGRDASSVDVSMVILTSPDPDSGVGKQRAHQFVSLYVGAFPNLARETGLDPELLADAHAAFQAGGVEASGRVIPMSVVDELCAAGTPEECQERIDEYRAAGVELPVVVALGDSVELALDTLQ